MAEEARWVWEISTQRYRSLDTGRFLSSSDVLSVIDGIVDRTIDEPTTTLNTLLADGRLSTAEWKTGFARQIKNAYIQQAELAAGGREQMTQAMWGSVGGSVREQYNFLDGFARKVESGQLTQAQIEARTKMYINSSRESFWRVKDMKASAAGFTEERWIAVGDDATCGPCSDADAMNWQPIGTFAQPGSGRVLNRPQTNCEGLTNCRCEKEYRGQEDERVEAEQPANIETQGMTTEQVDIVTDANEKFTQVYDGPAADLPIRTATDFDAVARMRGDHIAVNPDQFDSALLDDRTGKRIRRSKRRIKTLEQFIEDNRNIMSSSEIQEVNDQISDLEDRINELKSRPDWSAPKTLQEVILHEYGHAIQDDLREGVFPDITEFLPPSELRRRGLAFEDSLGFKLEQIAKSEGDRISEYAMTDGQEYFAESFVRYLQNKKSGIHPDLIDIFDEVLK